MQSKFLSIIPFLVLMGCTKANEFVEEKSAQSHRQFQENDAKANETNQKVLALEKYSECMAEAKSNEAMEKCESLRPHADEEMRKSKAEAEQKSWDRFTGNKTDAH